MYAASWAKVMAVLSLAAAASAGAAEMPDNNPLVRDVRAANARFQDVKAAVAEGYAPIPCTSGADGGAMGVHYVNPQYIKDDAPDIKHPAAVMYEPGPGGKMELIGVEYIATKGPAQLGGHLFSFQGAPNRYGLPAFYELHVWAWRANPKGAFTDMNPSVSCDHMMMGH